jgi:hypothetical protein
MSSKGDLKKHLELWYAIWSTSELQLQAGSCEPKSYVS